MEDFSLELLLRLIPLTPEFADVRQELLAGSRADRSRRWSGSNAYSTLDSRVIGAPAVRAIFAAAEARTMERVRALNAAVLDALLAQGGAREADTLDTLADMGEAALADANWSDCAAYYGVVERIALGTGDSDRIVLAARRQGRAYLNLGDLSRAAHAYERALQHAQEIGDDDAQVIIATGLGHCMTVQGRWAEAELYYRTGLELAGEGVRQLRAQLGISLAVVARERGNLEEASALLDGAAAEMDALSDADRSTWHNNTGAVLMDLGRHGEARAHFEQALELSPSHYDSAMILDNMAEQALREGRLDEAESLARRAEELALAGAAPRALTDVYVRLGRLSRLRRDPDGIVFFEKAIEIARQERYAYAEAVALLEYALLRDELDDADEADELRAAAHELLRSIGADEMPARFTS